MTVLKYSHLKLSLAVLCLINLFAACAELPVGVTHNGYAFFVAPDGNDAWSGVHRSPNASKSDGPFATIEKARDTIRMLSDRDALSQPVTVYVREGFYELAQPIVFTPEDSGTLACPITYSAYPGEEPVLSAGRKIAASGFVREGEIVRFPVPEAAQGWEFHQLFINGERRTRARTPNEDYLYTEGEISMDEQARVKFLNEDIQPEWAQIGNVEMVTPAKWTQYRMPIVAVDTENRTAALAGKMFEWIRENGQRYWIENLREALDAPGEWYLDTQKGELLYFLKQGEDPAKLELIAPVHDRAIVLQGNPAESDFIEHIHFKGLTVSHTAWTMPSTGHASPQAAIEKPGAFSAEGAVSCTIEHCVFEHLGNYAIDLGQGCKNNYIVGNTLYDLGAGGIKIGEPAIRKDERLLTIKNRITDNHIHHYGRVFPEAVGIWIGQSSYNTIAHNHIHDGFYTGISVGWTWGYSESNAHHNMIEYNHVHDLGKHYLSDMGGIYLLGMQPGTIVRNNIFHDVYSYQYGGWGIYTDEGSTEILIENNIAYNNKNAGFHQHYGKENIIRNNIFAFGIENQIMRTRMEPHISFTFENNIVYWDRGNILGSNWSDDNYKMDKNIYWNPQSQDYMFAKWTWDEWRARGQDVNSQIADPMFRDAEAFDFRLEEDSPALALGFNPIDVSTVGPREDFLREN